MMHSSQVGTLFLCLKFSSSFRHYKRDENDFQIKEYKSG